MFYRKQIIEAVFFLSVLHYGDVIYRRDSVSTLTPLDSTRFVTVPSDSLLLTVITLIIIFYMKKLDGHL